MSSSLLLAYHRREGTLVSGIIGLVRDDSFSCIDRFDDIDYREMIKSLARHIQSTPDADSLRFERIGKDGVRYALQATKEEVDGFRQDPVSLFRALVLPDQKVHIGAEVVVPTPRLPPVLQAGWESLMECFGDNVYVNLRKKACAVEASAPLEVECPVCGMWALVSLTAFTKPTACCTCCRVTVPLGDLRVNERAASILVDDLLRLPASEFYLPRRWNAGRWIKRADLELKFRSFREEKEKLQ